MSVGMLALLIMIVLQVICTFQIRMTIGALIEKDYTKFSY